MPKLNHIEKMNKAPYKDTKKIGEEFRIKTKTRGINFNLYYLAQYTQNIIFNMYSFQTFWMCSSFVCAVFSWSSVDLYLFVHLSLD